MRSIFDGYLTDGCKNCPDWLDGSDPNKGYGCGTHYPIDWCPHFAKLMEEDNKRWSKVEAMRKALALYPSTNQKKEYILYDDSGLGHYYSENGIVCFPEQADKFTIDDALVVSRMESYDGHHWKIIRVKY